MKSFNFTCLNHNLFSSLLIFTICLIHSARNEDDGAQNLRRKDKQKSVTLYLNSKWNETPLHLETAEYLSEEHTDYFWTFIEILHQNANQYRLSNAKQQYDMLLDSAGFVLDSPSKFSLLKFSLSLRTYSPTIEMYNQIAMDRRQVFGIESGTCNSFIELSSTSNVTTYVCDIETLSKSLTALRNANDKLTHPNVYKFDHGYSTRDSSLIVAILYGDCISDSFISLYKALKEQTNVNDLKLIVRYYVDHISKEKVALSGYGVELAIKSTEYKAQDDARVKGEKTTIAKNLEEAEQKEDEVVDGIDFSILKDKLPDKKKQLDEFRSHLIERSKEIANFKVWELEELSLQAATKILSAPTNEQLDLLQDISQNFPVVAKSLVNVVTDKHLKMETRQNQMIFMQKMNLAPTDSALFVNGMYFDLESIDVFTLVQYLKQEVRLIEGLYRILGNNQKAQELIKLDISDEKEEYQIDIRDSAVIYINDIENDKTYRSWPASVQEMLRPTFPGMLRSIRRNIYHLVLIVDPSKQESFDLIKLAESFYVHKAPLRIGFVFAVNPNATISGYDDAGVACVNAFNFISQDKSNYDGLSFLTDVIETSAGRDMTSNDVVSLFSSKYPKENVDVVFGSDSAYDTGRVLAWEYLNKTGLGKPMKALLNGVVLKNTHLNGDLFEEAVLMEIMRATAVIQEAVHRGDLLDSMDVLDWLMSRKTVMPRLNDKILASPSSLKQSEFLDFSGNSIAGQLSNDAFEALPRSQALASFKNALHHIYSTSSKCLPITLWLAGDFDIEEHRKILGDALEYLRSNSNFMRLALVYHQNATGVVSRAIEAALSSFKSNASALNFLIKLVSAANDEVLTPEAIFKLVPEDVLPPFKEKFERVDEISDVVGLHRAFVSRFLKLGPRDAAVVVNGRIIKIAENEPLLENDFALIEKHAMLTYGEKVLKQLEKSEEDADRCSDVLMAVGNVLTSHPQQKTRQEISVHKDQHSVIKMKPQQESEPAIEIVAVVEPLSRGAQKLAPILIALKKVINMDVKVFLNCIEKHSEMPLKNFFRFVVQPELTYSETGALSKPKAHFASMPTSSLLTLGVITLDNWLVGSVYADYDLDNIHLEEVEGSGVMAVFELEYLLLEGHCFDQSTGNPPRGLQFVLGTKSNPALFDTIVMANLGYFQLKANPGAWNLRLRSGRSENIYSIVAHENTDSDESETSDVQVVISNFRSHVVKIRVNKKPGKENEQLLYDNDENDLENSIWGSLASWTSSSTGKKKPENALVNDEESNRLNIFSLASGHLYERLLRIMMLSVLKNTKANVKFWFLKNYLSPGFKQFLPYMAQNYSFEYELVEYKWPRWLRQQSEKQRIIWGYKILFLDVLFPLNVKKIIFVDADQVVRTDLTELRDLDLEGAPYGYTPFCESRKDMDGYRFWKSGYWASHLRGRKYHISALYVVDLQKFRRIAAGDRLRGQYQDLSQDPNSLSNLDQDLPNNMIHQVNIKSLPQEWLWCETWCDDKSKRTAKTIDLCNNPKTKEPKLTAARRVIAEWETYDKEIANLMDEYLAKQRENVIDSIETTGEEQSPLQHTDTHTEL